MIKLQFEPKPKEIYDVYKDYPFAVEKLQNQTVFNGGFLKIQTVLQYSAYGK